MSSYRVQILRNGNGWGTVKVTATDKTEAGIAALVVARAADAATCAKVAASNGPAWAATTNPAAFTVGTVRKTAA